MHAVLVLFRPLPNVGIQNYGMWGMYTLVKAYRSIQKSIANLRVKDWEASNGCTKDTTRLFHGPWHDPVGENLRAQPCRMWDRLRFHPFLQVSQIFQRRKSDANKQDFENKLNLTCEAHSTPKTIGILTKVFWTSGPNSVVLAWTDDELSGGQVQIGVNFEFEGEFDLEGKGQSPPKTIGTLTKVFYIYGLNLVILAWTGFELSRGQASDWHTDGQTDAGNDNTRWPYRPWVKTGSPFYKPGLTLFPAWISNHMHYKVWDEITYPLPNFNCCTADIWEWVSNFIPHFTGHVTTYPCWN